MKTNSKNIVLNLVYRPPNGDHKELENYFKSSLPKPEISHKDVNLAGDFNINLLDFDTNKNRKVQNFVNLMFHFGMITTINKPTRVTRQTASAINHIITDSIMHTGFKSGIIKTGTSDNFPIFFCYKYITEKEDAKKEFIYKRRFSNQSIFKIGLCNINWSKVRHCRNANQAYINFFHIIDSLYDECFPVAKIRLKQMKHFTPWIKRGIKSPPKESRNYTKERRKI